MFNSIKKYGDARSGAIFRLLNESKLKNDEIATSKRERWRTQINNNAENTISKCERGPTHRRVESVH